MAVPQGKRGRSIQSWLILLLLFILIPVLAIQAYMYYESYQARRASELQANLEIARLLAKTFESFVQDVIHQELAIGLAITSSQPMTPKDITRLLNTSKDYFDVRDFTWMNPKGDAIHSGNPAAIGRNYSDQSYFREVANGREWAVGELVISKTSGKPIFGISRGMRDEKGDLLGVVVAMIIPEILDSRLAVERSKGGGFALVDNKGMLVYRHPSLNATWEERNWLKQYPEFGEALTGKEIVTTLFAPHEGKNRLVGLTPVPSIGWAAIAGKREEDATWPILGSIAENALLFLFVSLAAFFIALAVSRKIARPVTALRAHSLALGRGEKPGLIRLDDIVEVQDLTEAFNTMAEKVRARETALRDSEERLRFALESSHTGAWDLNLVDHTAFCAQEHDRIFGYAELLPRWSYEMFLEHVLPEDRAEVDAKFLHATETRGDWSFECRILRKDGAVRWIWVVGRHRVDEAGVPHRMAGIVQDITERKQAEEALHEAKNELEERVKERTYELYAESLYARSLIEASLDPLVTISIDGKIMDVNRATEDVTGIAREQLIGSDYLDYFTEPEKARAGYEEVFQKGFVRDYPLELKHRDGHVTPVLYNATLYRDETGETMGVFAAARDITEQKRSEETVKAERQRLYDVLETLPVYVILLTPDYQVPFANRFFRERFGESHGKRCYEYLFERMEPCETCETYTVQKTGKPHHWEWTGPDGRNYDIFDFPFKDFDGSATIMEVGIDITERKQAEAALRKLASELVMAEERERKRIAGILHDEVAQTLAAAKMHIDMLKAAPADREQNLTEAKALLVQSIRETRSLMADIGNPLLFDMGLKTACESLAERLMERHPVRITCDVREAFKYVNPDVKTILYQLIRELLNNVVKHSRAKKAHVWLDTDDGHFRVKVTDDGVGFDPQTLGAPTVEGGFGLYSIRERLLAIDGSLRIESAPGSGTIVTAIVPAALN